MEPLLPVVLQPCLSEQTESGSPGRLLQFQSIWWFLNPG